jgi:hypothetical protein
MNTQLSVSATVILNSLLAGNALSKTVARTTGLALPVVTGSLAGLKKNGFVEVLDTKELKLTQAGRILVSPAVAVVEYAKPAAAIAAKRSKGDVKAAAVRIVVEEEGSKRSVIVKRFIDELGMSPQGASTYHYNLVGNKGRWK